MHGAIENIKFYIPPPPNFVMPQFSASGTHTIVGSEIVGEAPGSFDLKVTHSQSATISTVRICVPEAYWGKIYTYLYKLQHGALDAMWEPFQHPAAPEGGVHEAEEALEQMQVSDDPPSTPAEGYSTVLRF